MSQRNVFTTHVPAPSHGLDSYNLSHEKKMSFKMGNLIPIYWDDIIPGDIFRVNSEVFIKFAPMLAPVLHRIDVTVHYFWTPYRLLMRHVNNTYADWEGFITGDPESRYTNEVLPYVTMSNANKAYFEKGDLPDYFGLPPIPSAPAVTQDIDINCLPFLAYQLIYDEYYRDQNLETRHMDPDTHLVGGDQNGNIDDIVDMQVRAYEKDYFTSALPTAYAGSSDDVELGLDLYGLGTSSGLSATFEKAASTPPVAGDPTFNGVNYTLRDSGSSALYFQDSTKQSLEAILEIYELRRAEALVRSLEAEQRGGKRYVEMLLGKFGVISDDYRTAIPQYLGGGKQHVTVESVKNMSQALDPTAGVNDGAGGVPVTIDPQSTESGFGVSVGKTNNFQRKFTEHGVVLGIMSVIPRTAYQDGIERYWRKVNDRYDFFDPYMQGIGDQAIDQSEVYWDQTGSDKDDVFGYTPRWAEYKYTNSSVHGDFRDDFDYWHCGIKLSSAPSLNEAFIKATPTRDELNRIFAVETASVDKIYAQVYNNVRALRMPRMHDIPR